MHDEPRSWCVDEARPEHSEGSLLVKKVSGWHNITLNTWQALVIEKPWFTFKIVITPRIYRAWNLREYTLHNEQMQTLMLGPLLNFITNFFYRKVRDLLGKIRTRDLQIHERSALSTCGQSITSRIHNWSPRIQAFWLLSLFSRHRETVLILIPLEFRGLVDEMYSVWDTGRSTVSCERFSGDACLFYLFGIYILKIY